MKIKQCLYLYIFLYSFSRLQQPQIKDYIVPWFLVTMPKIVLFTFIQKRKKPPLCTQVLCDRVEIILDMRQGGTIIGGIWLAGHTWKSLSSSVTFARDVRFKQVNWNLARACFHTAEKWTTYMDGRKKKTNKKKHNETLPCSAVSSLENFPPNKTTRFSCISCLFGFFVVVGNWVDIDLARV